MEGVPTPAGDEPSPSPPSVGAVLRDANSSDRGSTPWGEVGHPAKAPEAQKSPVLVTCWATTRQALTDPHLGREGGGHSRAPPPVVGQIQPGPVCMNFFDQIIFKITVHFIIINDVLH